MSLTANNLKFSKPGGNPPKQSFKDIMGFKKKKATPFQKRVTKKIQAGEISVPTEITSKADLAPFVNPNTGKSILGAGGQFVRPGERRQKPGAVFRQELATGGDLAEARDFEFDLPESNIGAINEQTQQVANNALNQGQAAIGAGAGLVGQGVGTTGAGTGAIQSALDQFTGIAPQFEVSRERALQDLTNLQNQALNPEIPAEQRQFFQDLADRRRADINFRFSPEGDIGDLFNKQRQSDIAVLQNRGVLDSATGANTLAARDLGLAAQLQNALSAADEQTTQELLGERAAQRAAAGQFGNLQSLQAAQQGNALLNALGGIASGGESIGKLGLGVGELGLGQQNIGRQLGALGLGALGQMGQLGLAERGQLSNEQLAEIGTRINAQQGQLGNLFANLNQRQQGRGFRQGFALNEQLADQLGEGGGFFGGLGNFLGTGLTAGLGGFGGGFGTNLAGSLFGQRQGGQG